MGTLVFIDSNFLLQLKDPKELPWEELQLEGPIHLLLPRIVVKEIDALKADGSSRRAKRARKASSNIFRELRRAKERRIQIRHEPIPVSIELAPPPDFTKVPRDLTQGSNDERLLAEVISYNVASGANAGVLSTDTILLITAEEHGLDTIEPPKTWLLDPEPDHRDKKIRQLEEKIQRLEQRDPILKLRPDADPIIIKPTQYQPLSTEQLDQLVGTAKSQSPIATSFGRPPTQFEKLAYEATQQRYIPVTEEEIAQYRETDYPHWLERLRNALQALPDDLTQPTQRTNAALTLSNTGGAPAEGLLIEIRVSKGFEIRRPNSVTSPTPSLPRPPKPPRPRVENPYDITKALSDLTHPSMPYIDPMRGVHLPEPPRDPLVFYRRETEPTRWELDCEEFRHQHEHIFGITLLALNPADHAGGILSIRATARNMATVFEERIPIRVKPQPADPLPAATKLISQLTIR